MPCGFAPSVHNFVRAAGLLTLLGALSAAGVAAQLAPAPPSHSDTRAASPLTPEILPLDFLIRTKSGKPVLDLKPSDLLVTDNGAAVDLKSLRLVKGTDGQDRLVTLVFDSLDGAAAQNARKLAAKILAQFPSTGYTYAVLQIAGTSHNQTTAIVSPGPSVLEITSPDATGLPPQSAGAPGAGLRLLQSYTTNRDSLQTSIDQATSGDAAQPSGPDATPAEEQLHAFARRNPRTANAEDLDRAELLLSAMNDSRHPSEDRGSDPSLSALLALVRSQRRVAGRKIVIYFSPRRPADNDSLNTAGSIIAEANRSEVSIVTVDTSRTSTAVHHDILAAMGAPAAGELYQPIFQQIRPFDSPDAPLPAFASVASYNSGTAPSISSPPNPLAVMATVTGGVSFARGGNFKRTLQRLRDELTDYYEAKYVPSIASYNGAFHRLLVYPRRPHLVVRTRAGYFALPPEGSSEMRLYELPLLAILATPRLPTEIAYRSQVLQLGEFSGKNIGELVVEVPLSQLQVRSDADTHLSSAHIALLMQVRNAQGEVLARYSEDVLQRRRADVARLEEDRYSADTGNNGATADRDAIVMEHPFTAEPGNYTLETAVLDDFGNKAAAQRAAFTIPPPQPHALLSDLTLVRRIDPLPGGDDAQQFEPLRYRRGRIIPDLTCVLPEDIEAVSFFLIAHLAGPAQPQLTLRIRKDGRTVSDIPLTLALPTAHAGGNAAAASDVLPWLGTVEASGFPPGRYEVEAMVSQHGQTATASRSFVVEGKGTTTNISFTAVSGEADPDRDMAAERRLTESAADGSSSFSISAPANPLPPPTRAKVEALVESVRQRALAWTASLPNFLCIETTWHSLYSRSSRSWQPSDTAVQQMRYIDHVEDRTLVELNGRRSQLPFEVAFAHSTGEFGGALRAIFDPAADAQFTWKGTDLLDGDLVQVLAYTVPRASSSFSATNESNGAFVGFHGQVWVDAATHNIRRITETLDDMPTQVGIRAASISIDYAWVTIDHHEYMLPVHGAMSVLRGRHQAELNQFAFTDYHRFGAEVRVVPMQPSQAKLGP